jgi:hypothetical protein
LNGFTGAQHTAVRSGLANVEMSTGLTFRARRGYMTREK